MTTKQIYDISRASFGREHFDNGYDFLIMTDGTLFHRSYMWTAPVNIGDWVEVDHTYEFVGQVKPPDIVRMTGV